MRYTITHCKLENGEMVEYKTKSIEDAIRYIIDLGSYSNVYSGVNILVCTTWEDEEIKRIVANYIVTCVYMQMREGNIQIKFLEGIVVNFSKVEI